jgi:hypothetical protein
LVCDRGCRDAGEREEVRLLVSVELERPRDRVEYLSRRTDIASLLEPRVPGDADTGELRDLLATEPRSPPPPRCPQAHLLGLDALPAAA